MIHRVLQKIASSAAAVLLSLPVRALPAPVGLPDNEPAITVWVMGEGKNGPVQVTGLKQPQKPTRYPLVHLRNGSSVPTKHISIEAIIDGGADKIAHIESGSSKVRSRSGRGIAPYSDGWVQEPILQSSALVLFAKELHSTCLKVAVLVTRVEFTNGSSWNRDQSQKPDWLMLSHEAGIGDPCKRSAVSDSDLELLTSAEYAETPDAEVPDPTEVRTYLFCCPLVRRSSGLVAMCPF